jgi:hypothetical protein
MWREKHRIKLIDRFLTEKNPIRIIKLAKRLHLNIGFVRI